MGNKLPGATLVCCDRQLPFVRPETVTHSKLSAPPPGVPPSGSYKDKKNDRLADLEADFNKVAGRSKVLNPKDLSNVWKRFAERQLGELDEEDARLIESSALIYHKLLDVDRNGFVSYPEFATFMLGGMEERAQIKNMRGKLRAMVKSHPEMLKRLITKFRQWDKNGDGYVTRRDLKKSLDDIRTQKKASTDTEVILSEILEKANYESDDKIELWELIAYSLGRRKMPVELLLYDISSGASRHASPLLLGHNFEAIYHTGILAFDREFWYGGKIFHNNPPTSAFGTPLARSGEVPLQPSYYRPELQVVHLGYTFVNSIEFNRHLSEDLAFKYTPDSYEVLTHNCNSFCEDAARFLTGSGIPTQVLELPQRMMASPVAQMLGGPRALRPLLNKWLGGFDSEGNHASTTDDREQDLESEDTLAGAAEPVIPAAPRTRLCEGTIVLVSGGGATSNSEEDVVGSVIYDDGDAVDLRCFDPLHGGFVNRYALPCATVKQTLSLPPAKPTPSASPRLSSILRTKCGKFVTI